MQRLALVTAAFAVAMLGLTGCGSGEDPPQKLSKADYEKAVKYSACMTKYGLDVPVPDPDGEAPAGEWTMDPDEPKNAAALAACGRLSPAGHVQGEEASEAQVNRALKMAECLRTKGIKTKDPEPGKANFSIADDPGGTPEQVRAAYMACDKKYPAAKS
ncbi:hypothetical protein [Streptomyces phaeochromogenes]|uniref:hypothetical protein n=1 Tax=Streptomyces phaeochromogenes TaxID=1923 RepID=UPI003710234D